jgi:hypothetical protein
VSWVKELWQHDCTHHLSLKLDIDKNKWSNNLLMSGENKVHMRHMKTLPEKMINYPP